MTLEQILIEYALANKNDFCNFLAELDVNILEQNMTLIILELKLNYLKRGK